MHRAGTHGRGTDLAQIDREPAVRIEKGEELAVSVLARFGHDVASIGSGDGGGAVQLIEFDRSIDVLRGAGDRRCGGLALDH